MTGINEQFRELVLTEMDRQGISKSELARRMGTTPQYVNTYLNPKSPTRAGILVMHRFCDALGMGLRLRAMPIDSP